MASVLLLISLGVFNQTCLSISFFPSLKNWSAIGRLIDEAKGRKSVANYLDKRVIMSIIFLFFCCSQFLKSEFCCFSFFLSFTTVNKESGFWTVHWKNKGKLIGKLIDSLQPIFTFLVPPWPLVALVNTKAANEEVRQSSIKSNKVCIGEGGSQGRMVWSNKQHRLRAKSRCRYRRYRGGTGIYNNPDF